MARGHLAANRAVPDCPPQFTQGTLLHHALRNGPRNRDAFHRRRARPCPVTEMLGLQAPVSANGGCAACWVCCQKAEALVRPRAQTGPMYRRFRLRSLVGLACFRDLMVDPRGGFWRPHPVARAQLGTGSALACSLGFRSGLSGGHGVGLQSPTVTLDPVLSPIRPGASTQSARATS